MNALNRSFLAMVVAVSLQQAASAQLQLIPAKDAQIFYMHHHMYVSNIDAQMKFWVDTLGGTPAGKFPNTQIEVVNRDFFHRVSILGPILDLQVSGFYDRFHFQL